MIAVLIAHAEGVRVGAVLRGQQGREAGAIDCRGAQRVADLWQKHDGDIGEIGCVGTQNKAGQALIEQARFAQLTVVIQLAHRPRHVTVRRQQHAAVRIAQLETAQVQAAARSSARLVRHFPAKPGEPRQQTARRGRVAARSAAAVGTELRRQGGAAANSPASPPVCEPADAQVKKTDSAAPTTLARRLGFTSVRRLFQAR